MTTQRHPALALADKLDSGEHFYAESSLWFDSELADAAGDAAALLRRIPELETENARLLAANRDCIDHFDALKADYDELRASKAELLEALERAIDPYRHKGALL